MIKKGITICYQSDMITIGVINIFKALIVVLI